MSLRRSARLKAKEKKISYADPNTESDDDESDSERNSNESNVSSNESTSYSEYELECVCGEANDDRIRICCDKCSIWYHYDCAQLTLREVNKLSRSSKKWLCPSCSNKYHKKRKRKRKRSKSREYPTNKRQKRRIHSNDDSSVEHQILKVIIESRKKRMSRVEIASHISSFDGSLVKILRSMTNSGVLRYGKTTHMFKITKKGKKEFENVTNIRRAFDTSSASPSMNVAPFQMPFLPQPIIDKRRKRVVQSSEEPDYSLSAKSVSVEPPQVVNNYQHRPRSVPLGIPQPNTQNHSQTHQDNPLISMLHPTVHLQHRQISSSVPLEMPNEGYNSQAHQNNFILRPTVQLSTQQQRDFHAILGRLFAEGSSHQPMPLQTYSVPLDMPSSQETIENIEESNQLQQNGENQTDGSDLEILNDSNSGDKETEQYAEQIITKSFDNHACIKADVTTNYEENEASNESDDSDILIQAGDQWIENDKFLQNKEEFKKDIALKRKQQINENLKEIDSENEDELIVLNKDQKSNQNICPLTLKKIENPIQNRLCSHIYERSAILNYRNYLIANNKATICPQGGCQATLFGF